MQSGSSAATAQRKTKEWWEGYELDYAIYICCISTLFNCPGFIRCDSINGIQEIEHVKIVSWHQQLPWSQLFPPVEVSPGRYEILMGFSDLAVSSTTKYTRC